MVRFFNYKFSVRILRHFVTKIDKTIVHHLVGYFLHKRVVINPWVSFIFAANAKTYHMKKTITLVTLFLSTFYSSSQELENALL